MIRKLVQARPGGGGSLSHHTVAAVTARFVGDEAKDKVKKKSKRLFAGISNA